MCEPLVRSVEHTAARLKRTVVKPIDAHSLFVHYRANLAAGMSKEDARKDFLRLLEANLRTFTQEGIGAAQLNEYGIEVRKDTTETKTGTTESKLQFRNAFAQDAIASIRTENAKKYGKNQILLHHFELELTAWEKLYMDVVAPLEHLIGRNDTPELIPDLHELGFRHLVPGNAAPGLCDVSPLLVSLFPELDGVKQVEMYEAPEKYIMASPRFWGHHKGETTIARLTRFVYIPSIGKFAFLERGLFTSYTNEQILEFFTLDGKPKPDLHSAQEILAHVAVLAEVYREMAPLAVFQSIIDKIGVSPEVKVDEKIERTSERDFRPQLEYIEAILAFEEELCLEHPELLLAQERRLDSAMRLVMHSLLRNVPLNVRRVANDYEQIYSDLRHAQNPKAATRLFNTLTLASHPDIATRFLSIFDCGTGMVLGVNAQSLMDGLNGIDMYFGAGAGEMLTHFETHGITTQSELDAFCKTFHLDASTFSNRGVCKNPGCKCISTQFLGPCGWCPVCEAKDNLKQIGWNPNAKNESNVPTRESNEEDNSLPRQPVGLDLFVAAIPNPSLIRERSFADYTSPAVH